MKSTLKLIVVTLASALVSTAALAGEGDDRAVAVTATTAKTRAQVQAELVALPQAIEGDRYPMIRETPSTLSRAEVRALNARAKAQINPGA